MTLCWSSPCFKKGCYFMFSVRLINGEESTMSLQELKGFCWDMGVDFSRVQEVIDKDTEFGGMTVKTAA